MDEIKTYIHIENGDKVRYIDMEDFVSEYGLKKSRVIETTGGALLIEHAVHVTDSEDISEKRNAFISEGNKIQCTLGKEYSVKVIERLY